MPDLKCQKCGAVMPDTPDLEGKRSEVWQRAHLENRDATILRVCGECLSAHFENEDGTCRLLTTGDRFRLEMEEPLIAANLDSVITQIKTIKKKQRREARKAC